MVTKRSDVNVYRVGLQEELVG